MKNPAYTDDIPSLTRRFHNMRRMTAIEELSGKGCSTIHNRLGLIFTCVNSMAGIREDGNIGDIEAVKDALVKSDVFRNQRDMIISEWQSFYFYLFVINFQQNIHKNKLILDRK
jgi:hypothetical protein